MNFLSCEYFLIIKETGTISEAASILRISQQSLSQQLQNLEKELDTTLFIRSKPLQLTKAGKVFEKYSREIISSKKHMFYELEQIKKEHKISIGLELEGVPPFLNNLIILFRKKCPDAFVSINNCFNNLKEMTMNDFVFVNSQCNLQANLQMKQHILFEDRPSVVINDTLLMKIWGKEWKIKKRQLLEDGDIHLLKDFPFLSSNRLSSFNSHISLDNLYTNLNFFPKSANISGNEQFVQNMCLIGEGILIMPEKLAKHTWHRENGIEIYPILNNNLKLPLILWCKKVDPMPESMRIFLNITLNYFKNL